MSVKRISQMRQQIIAENLDGLIVTDLNTVRYLTGFTGSAGLLFITEKKADFFSVAMQFRRKSRSKAPGFTWPKALFTLLWPNCPVS